MRQERDFQYRDWHLRPYGDPPFLLEELVGLIHGLERLPAAERARHLSRLGARNVEEVRSRLEPRVTFAASDTTWRAVVEHTSLDGRNHLSLELRGDPRVSTASLTDDRVTVRARSDGPIELEVSVTTDAEPLTPLARPEIFNEAFDTYYARERRRADRLSRTSSPELRSRDPRLAAFRRFDRQVRGLELLAYEEKLLASMPNYASRSPRWTCRSA
jgi:hypothetical protein